MTTGCERPLMMKWDTTAFALAPMLTPVELESWARS
jgi:hypothetical protein